MDVEYEIDVTNTKRLQVTVNIRFFMDVEYEIDESNTSTRPRVLDIRHSES